MSKQFKDIHRVLCFLMLFVPGPAWSADLFLQDVRSELSGGALTVRFEFNQPVKNTNEPVFSNKSVRVDIPGALVRPEKRFYYTGDPRIPQIFASQHNSDTLRLQLVLGETLPRLQESFQMEDQGRTLVIHLFKRHEDVLSEFLARAAERMASGEDREEAQVADPPAVKNMALADQGGSFNVKKIAADYSPAKSAGNSVSPDDSRGSNFSPAPPVDRGPGGERERVFDPVAITVKTFTMFALVLALMFIVFYLFKKFVLKNTLFGGNEKIVKVLGNGYLGPKKNIVLVEVAGEILVLGTSNDNISLLTHIQDKEKIEKIKASGKDVPMKNFWNQAKGKGPASKPDGETSILDGAFSNYLEQFTGAGSEKEKSVEEVTGLIRKNLGKLKSL